MYAALVEFVEQMRPPEKVPAPATWDEVRIAWKNRYEDERPDWAKRYSRGDKLAAAYKRHAAA